jgi:thioredoxin-dependent peroxiredoxin
MVHSLIGKPAPTFSATDTHGKTYDFTTGGGVPTVLFFYPKAGTSSSMICVLLVDVDDRIYAGSMGCIREVSQLQTLTEKDSFKQARVRMVGVSADSVEKQKEFAKKQKLTVSYLVVSE